MNTMIKTTYLILGSALLLSSCAQEEMPNNGTISGSDRRIVFRTSLPEVTSRAEVVSTDDLKKFHVTAFNPKDPNLEDGPLEEFIKNEELEWDVNSKSYISERCKWPEMEQEENVLHFFAYYPDLNNGASLENSSTVSDNDPSFSYKIKDFHVATDLSEQVDFVTAHATASMAVNLFSGVNLEFNHKLSRVEVKAKSENKSCKLEIAGVRIGGICTRGTYNFKAEETAGDWDLSDDRENVEYIFGPEDKIVALNDTTEAFSIMGGSDGVNYAMLLPSSNTGWDFANDHTNSKKGLYLSVLLRVLDKTPNGNDKQQYPYYDNSQGLNAMNIPRVYLAVNNAGIVTANPGKLYKDADGKYYTDEAKTATYTAPAGSTVKEFGWAALPVTGNWEPGYAYTYTLDYTSGVGLHEPSVYDPTNSTYGPKAGDPIISDKIGVSVSVKEWQGDNKDNQNTINDVVVPGS